MSNRYLAHFLEDSGTQASAEAASGSGAAYNASISIEVSSAVASGSGAALDPTVSVGGATQDANAEVASGSGSAFDAAASVAASAQAATGTGAAHVIRASVSPTPSAATGTGTAHNPTVVINPSVSASAGVATGTGTAYNATGVPVIAVVGRASGTGAAHNAFVITFTDAVAEPGAPAPQALILYDGIDITADVMTQMAQFTSAANGSVGHCQFRVRDDGHTYSFSTGRNLKLTIEGQNVWQGYVQSVRRGFHTTGSEKGPGTRERYFEIQGVDLNVLFQRRILYDKIDPTRMQLTTFAAGTNDDVILKAYVDAHLDLSGDAITTTMVEHVGTPSTDSEISGHPSWSWGDFMNALTRNTGAVWYIDPDRNLVLTDVDTPTAPFAISDQPVGAQIGCRELEIDFDGTRLANDALVWGAGQGADHVVFQRTQDAASIAEHGRWQVGQFNQTAWRQATINRISASHVYGSPQSKRGGKDDGVAVRCVIFEPGYRVGQKVAIESQIFDYADTLPIRSMDVDFLPGGTPRYRLVLSHEIDPPWDIFEFWMPAFPDFDIGGIDIPGFDIPPIDIGPIVFNPWPPFDPCASLGECNETFSRSTSPGWGDSEFTGNPPWEGTTGLLTTGGTAIMAVGTGTNGADVNDLVLSMPVEVLVFWRFSGVASQKDAEFGFSIDDPLSGDTWGYVSLQRDFTGPTQNNALLVGNNFDDDQTVATVNAENGLWLWLRARFTADEVMAKIWEDGNSEPGAWDVTVSGSAWTSTPTRLSPYGLGTFAGQNIEIGQISFTDGCVGGIVGELMGLFNESCGGETETFTRTAGPNTWGTSEINSIPWVTYAGENAIGLEVDGTHGVFDNGPARTIQGLEVGAGFFSDPLDLCLYYECEITRRGSTNAQVYIELEDILGDFSSNFISTTLTMIVSGGDVLLTGRIDTTLDGSGTPDVIIGSWNGVSFTANIKVRAVWNETNSRVKFWLAGDPEPTAWNAEGIPLASFDWKQVFIQLASDTSDRPTYRFESISLGTPADGNPCGTVDEPDPDPSSGRVCEDLTLVEIDVDDHHWYRTTSQFEPRSTRVWVDGKLIRRTFDYLEHALLGKIEIKDHIDVDGKTIHACFDTAIIHALDPPVPL